MSGTFAPRPGAAPLASQVRAQALIEARLTMRNGEQLLLALVIPVLLLVGAVLGADRLGVDFSRPAVDELTPGVLALAILSSSFTSLAIMTGFERRYGVLKRLGSSPLPRHGLLLGKVGALLLVEALQLAVLGGVAATLGWAPANGWFAAVLLTFAGTFAFASLALLMAGALRAEATLAAANLVYVLLVAGGGVIAPSSSYGAAGGVLQWLPSAALGDGMRAAFLDGRTPWLDLAVLLAWGAVGTVLTARTFSWE